jgi:hypothetical protein
MDDEMPGMHSVGIGVEYVAPFSPSCLRDHEREQLNWID